MYDAYLVEQGTLKNDIIDGKVVGFSFGVRVSNYRGIYLSLVNGFYVTVDGVEYPRELQTYEINGKPPRPLSETMKSVWEHWALTDTLYIHVAKEGGLTPGQHEIGYMECTLAQYGYTENDEEYVNNPPLPGDPRGGMKTSRVNTYVLELKEA